MSELFTKQMVYTTKLSGGNNNALKASFDRAKKKEAITVAFLGGSITQWCNGDMEVCFAKKVFLSLEGLLFGKNNDVSTISIKAKEQSKYINAGLNGTTSTFGLIRLENDILKYQPDLVIIDFAVNDWKDQLHKEAFECILRDLLESKKVPGIIILANVMDNGYTCQAYMKELAEYYQIPIVGMADGIIPAIRKKQIKKEDYFADYVHPNEDGHTFIAECVMHCIRSEYERNLDLPYNMPNKPLHGASYQRLRYFMADQLPAKIQGFTLTNEYDVFGSYLKRTTFSRKDSLLFHITCKSFFIVYMECPEMNFGMGYVYVDGVLMEKLNGFNTTAWYNPSIRVIVNGECKEHEIEIKMAPGDEKKDFNILGIAYNIE